MDSFLRERLLPFALSRKMLNFTEAVIHELSIEWSWVGRGPLTLYDEEQAHVLIICSTTVAQLVTGSCDLTLPVDTVGTAGNDQNQ